VVLEHVGQADGCHPTVAELAQKGVAAGEGGAEAVEGADAIGGALAGFRRTD
jgi:hypothetical protein